MTCICTPTSLQARSCEISTETALVPHRLVLDRHLPNDGVEFRRCFKLENVTAAFEQMRLRPGCRGEEVPRMILVRRDPIAACPTSMAIGHLISEMMSGVWMVNSDRIA